MVNFNYGYLLLFLFNIKLLQCQHGNEDAQIYINRPSNGTGPILISNDSMSRYYNDERILVVFNISCLNSKKNDSLHNEILKDIHEILNTYRLCLKLFNSTTQHFDTDLYSYVFFDLECSLLAIQTKTNLSINYDELCIEYIIYEPLYYTQQSDTDQSHGCVQSTTDKVYSWGLDLLDSESLDDIYTSPAIPINNDIVDLYIVDSGIQEDHVEFNPGQIIHEMGTGADNLNERIWATHGTHVAGTASGINFGSSRNVTIYDYCVCKFNDEFEILCHAASITEALDKVYNKLKSNNRRGVINLSLGGEKEHSMNDIYHSYFDKIINVGGVPVVAAGNENQDACDVSPAYTTNAITVGSFNISRTKSHFSNWGDCVDIWSPGEPIYSSVASGDNDKYQFMAGTSMSSPIIAGVVVNLLFVQSTLTFEGIKDILLDGAVNISGNQCESYSCRAPIYSCGTVTYIDTGGGFSYNDGLSGGEIALIVIGCCLFVVAIVILILYMTREKKQIPHTKIADEDNPNVVVYNYDEQQTMM